MIEAARGGRRRRVPAEVPSSASSDVRSGDEPDLSPADERRICAEHARARLRRGLPDSRSGRSTRTRTRSGPSGRAAFDLLYRGLEIVTGGQRLHRYEDYRAALAARGLDEAPFDGVPRRVPVRDAAARRVRARPRALHRAGARPRERPRSDALSARPLPARSLTRLCLAAHEHSHHSARRPRRGRQEHDRLRVRRRRDRRRRRARVPAGRAPRRRPRAARDDVSRRAAERRARAPPDPRARGSRRRAAVPAARGAGARDLGDAADPRPDQVEAGRARAAARRRAARGRDREAGRARAASASSSSAWRTRSPTRRRSRSRPRES